MGRADTTQTQIADPLRIAFLGLPLGALCLARAGHELVYLGLSRPDSPGTRRVRAQFGERVHIAPELKNAHELHQMLATKPNLLVSWFWTKRIPARWLTPFGPNTVNFHPSLLPRHRGPDPYFWALLEGDVKTGVTAHRLAAEYDTGDIYAQVPVSIEPHHNSWTLAKALDGPSLRLMHQLVQRLGRSEALIACPQTEGLATHAPFPNEEQQALRFQQPVEQILRHVRALSPLPGAWFELGDELISLTAARTVEPPPVDLCPGEAVVHDGQVRLQCGDGCIEPLRGFLGQVPLGPEEFVRLISNLARSE